MYSSISVPSWLYVFVERLTINLTFKANVNKQQVDEVDKLIELTQKIQNQKAIIEKAVDCFTFFRIRRINPNLGRDFQLPLGQIGNLVGRVMPVNLNLLKSGISVTIILRANVMRSLLTR